MEVLHFPPIIDMMGAAIFYVMMAAGDVIVGIVFSLAVYLIGLLAYSIAVWGWAVTMKYVKQTMATI